MKKFSLFSHRLEIKLKKKQNKERILYLAKRLYRELEAQGYEFPNTEALKGFDVSLYTPLSGEKEFEVYNILNHWKISEKVN